MIAKNCAMEKEIKFIDNKLCLRNKEQEVN